MARALIVEDNELNRILVRELVTLEGHEATEAATAEEARALLVPDAFDVVLLDVQIPGGGGESVLRHVRAHPALARLPVVAVTALAMRGDRERLLAAGFDGYVSKPIEAARLSAVIAEALGKKPAR